MWDTPFEEWMLSGDHVIVLCHTAEAASELCTIFAAHGIKWAGGEPLPETTYFGHYHTCQIYYYVDNGLLRFGTKAEKSYENWTKCTFGAPCVLHDLSIPDDTGRSLMRW